MLTLAQFVLEKTGGDSMAEVGKSDGPARHALGGAPARGDETRPRPSAAGDGPTRRDGVASGGDD